MPSNLVDNPLADDQDWAGKDTGSHPKGPDEHGIQ